MDENVVLEQVKEICGNIFGIEMSELNINTKQTDIVNWDSLGHLRLMMAVEERFNIKIQIDEIITINGLKDIVNIIRGCRYEYKNF